LPDYGYSVSFRGKLIRVDMATLQTVFLSLWIAVFTHAISCRLCSPQNSVSRFLFVGSTVGGCFALYLYFALGPAPEVFAALMVYAACCELYIFLFTLASYSISANILVAISTDGMPSKEFDRFYNGDLMAAKRIERLVAVGLMEDSGTVLTPTAKARRLIRLFARLRAFFRHPPFTDV